MINLANLDAEMLSLLMVKIAKEPIFYKKQEDCPFLLKLKLEKTPAGFLELLQIAPDIVQDSPLLQNKTYSPSSTCARKIVEVGGDGSVSAAAMTLGYFPLMIANTGGYERGECGLLRVGTKAFQNWVFGLGSAAEIGTALVIIPEDKLDLWPEETAVQRIEEDLISLFLHIKTSLVPFGSIVIKTGLQYQVESVKSEECQAGNSEEFGDVMQMQMQDANSITHERVVQGSSNGNQGSEGREQCLTERVDMPAVACGAGFDLTKRSGHFRLDWNPRNVTHSGATRLELHTLNTPVLTDFLENLDVTSSTACFLDILDRTPQKGVPLSLRLAVVKRGRLISSMSVSQTQASSSAPCPSLSSGTSCSDFQQETSPTLETTASQPSEEAQTGSFGEHCSLQSTQNDGLTPQLPTPETGS